MPLEGLRAKVGQDVRPTKEDGATTLPALTGRRSTNRDVGRVPRPRTGHAPKRNLRSLPRESCIVQCGYHRGRIPRCGWQRIAKTRSRMRAGINPRVYCLFSMPEAILFRIDNNCLRRGVKTHTTWRQNRGEPCTCYTGHAARGYDIHADDLASCAPPGGGWPAALAVPGTA
jgi:hypothetical protein